MTTTNRQTVPLFGSVNLGLSAAGLDVDGRDLPAGNDDHGYRLRLRGNVHDASAPARQGYVGVDITIRGTLAELTALGDAVTEAIAGLIVSEYPEVPGLHVDAEPFTVPEPLTRMFPGVAFRPSDEITGRHEGARVADYIVDDDGDVARPRYYDEDGNLHAMILDVDGSNGYPFVYRHWGMPEMTAWIAVGDLPEPSPPTVADLYMAAAKGDETATAIVDGMS